MRADSSMLVRQLISNENSTDPGAPLMLMQTDDMVLRSWRERAMTEICPK